MNNAYLYAETTLPFMLTLAIIDDEPASFQKIALPTYGALHLIALEDIVRIESEGGYTTVFVKKGEKILL